MPSPSSPWHAHGSALKSASCCVRWCFWPWALLKEISSDILKKRTKAYVRPRVDYLIFHYLVNTEDESHAVSVALLIAFNLMWGGSQTHISMLSRIAFGPSTATSNHFVPSGVLQVEYVQTGIVVGSLRNDT